MGLLGAGSIGLACMAGLMLQTPTPREVGGERPFLRVAGEAEVATAPDLAVVTLGVGAQADQASAAQNQVSQVMQRVTAALVEAGVPAARIQTVGLSLYPVYSQPDYRQQNDAQAHEPRVVGFRAANTVRVRLEDIARIGNVLDAGLSAGANEIQGISFELSNDTAQRTEALAAAVRNARTKAEALADAAGVRLLDVQRIEESGGGAPEPMHRTMGFAAMEAGTPVEPGQVQVSARVVLTFRIASQGGDSPR